MSMLSVPVKDLNEKTTIDNDTYVVCGNMEANKITYENLVKPLRDELNSTLKSAIKFVDYQVTLDSNAYVAPFSYYANNYLPISDIEKYGTPISATLMTSSGQAHPVALTLMSNGKYHYTCVATAAKGVMTVVFLKLN